MLGESFFQEIIGFASEQCEWELIDFMGTIHAITDTYT